MKFLSERNREAVLLRWYRKHKRESGSGLVLMGEFDKMYQRLFGRVPLWYTWHHFYHDHGLVGLRTIG